MLQVFGLIVRRMITVTPIVIGVAVITFFLVNAIPGDPGRALAGPYASEATVAQIRANWRLDEPLLAQLLAYLGNLATGNLGVSIQSRAPVADEIFGRLPATLELSFTALLIMIVVGLGLGITAAVQNGRFLDHVARVVAVLGAALPVFWLALMAQLVFYSMLGWLPAVGRNTSEALTPDRITGFNVLDSILTGNWPALGDSVSHLILPALVLAVGGLAGIVRIARASMLEVLHTDYVRAATARGLGWRSVTLRHAFRNALLPSITVIGLLFGATLGGALVVEWVFAWPGIGTFAANSITNLDYPSIIGVTLLFAIAYLIVNLVVDVLYLVINPKLRSA